MDSFPNVLLAQGGYQFSRDAGIKRVAALDWPHSYPAMKLSNIPSRKIKSIDQV